MPLRVVAQRVTKHSRITEVLEIEIEVPASDLPPEAFRFVAAMINQLPTVVTEVAGK